ncbi:MAG: TIGR03663 family protein [Mariniphaga sp.]|nr:TIGR03663 family protein [Mariniphaga sp.]
MKRSGQMMPRTAMKYQVTAMVIILIASCIRLISLSERPMHTDEAVHAFKFAGLLEKGKYIYDKNEYHGPTLNYLSLLPARIKSQNQLVSLEEETLRMVPAFTGIFLILLMLLLVKSFGWPLILYTMLLLAISPALTYFSRYYIHEMLLIFFNAGFLVSLYRYYRSWKPGWIITAGIFAGLMVSTKETWIILAGVEGLALAIVYVIALRSPERKKNFPCQLRYSHLVLFCISAMAITIILFSSFFKNLQGVIDSIQTYADYFSRATQEGDHIYPWYYYYKLLTINSCDKCWFRADSWLLLSGIFGIIIILFQRPAKLKNYPVMLFLSLTTLFSGIVFSLIPYKTPWNILTFYTSNLFLSAWFFYFLSQKIKKRRIKWIFHFCVGFIILHLAWQSYSDNFVRFDHTCNPYVYAHPDQDIIDILKEVEQVAMSAPEGNQIFIEVIVPHDGYWPLPWYLRKFSHTGWWSEVDMVSPAAPLIICAPECSKELTHKLFDLPEPGKRYLYIPLMDRDPSLRPGIPVKLYLRKDYWDRYKSGKNS